MTTTGSLGTVFEIVRRGHHVQVQLEVLGGILAVIQGSVASSAAADEGHLQRIRTGGVNTAGAGGQG